MRRINLVLPNKYVAYLQADAVKKEVSLARHVRDLIEVGRQVEEAAAQQAEPSTLHNTHSSLDDSKELWKQSLLCALESRYLMRYLVDRLPDQSPEKRDAVLKAVKEKAQVLVNEWLDQ